MWSRIGQNNYDWILLLTLAPIIGAGLITLYSFDAANALFVRQLIWIGVGFSVFIAASAIDMRFLRETRVVMALYFIAVGLLLLLFVIGSTVKGATSWFDLGFFSLQPADPVKIILIIVLAKYFSRRHVEIRDFRHIFVSGLYAFIIFALIFLQPDFGSSMIILAIWSGMVLVSGISKRHIALLFAVAALAFAGLWSFVLDDYQKARVQTFLHPYADVSGAGYNAYQSMIAVGSGELLGKGIGYGTQSRLEFLPEYQSDFMFAAFSEEWGYVGALLLLFFFACFIVRILDNARYGASNFEVLYGVGLATFFFAHFVIHVGTNIGLLPVTGLTMPFMSYGGSHIVTGFLGLGILMSMRQYRRESREIVEQPDVL